MLSRSETIDALRILAARLSNLDEIAKALERVGSIEEQEKTARSRTEQAMSLAVLAEAELKRVQDSIHDVKESASKLTREAEAVREDAFRILQEAKEQADHVIEAARSQANQAAAARDASESQLAALNKKIADAKSLMAALLRD